MTRLRFFTALLAVLLLGSFSIGYAAPSAAHDDAAMSNHPLVGTWLVVDVGGPPDVVVISQFWADGNVLFTSPNGFTEHGVWGATGPTTADLITVGFIREQGAGHVGNSMLTGTIDVDPSGDTYHATADFEYIGLDQSVINVGSIEFVGTRVTLETTGMIAATPTP